MLKHLIVQLDDTSVSFCHYNNDRLRHNLMTLDTLKEAILWSMKENLTIQFLYPDYKIPEEYKSEIGKTFHANIVSSNCEDDELRLAADIVVFDTLASSHTFPFDCKQSYVFRTTLAQLIESSQILTSILPKVDRINILITDLTSFKHDDEAKYSEFLDSLSDNIVDEYKAGHSIQVNLLTDRILLDGMNNCNAGYETITLCPDGNFYVCPAFYCDDKDESLIIGTLHGGLDIKNSQLYKLSHAPICRICDAYQCHRCIWLNRRTTLEVNTPSREQCVVAHLERNASLHFLSKIRKFGTFLPDKTIPEINYIDPFDKINEL